MCCYPLPSFWLVQHPSLSGWREPDILKVWSLFIHRRQHWAMSHRLNDYKNLNFQQAPTTYTIEQDVILTVMSQRSEDTQHLSSWSYYRKSETRLVKIKVPWWVASVSECKEAWKPVEHFRYWYCCRAQHASSHWNSHPSALVVISFKLCFRAQSLCGLRSRLRSHENRVSNQRKIES